MFKRGCKLAICSLRYKSMGTYKRWCLPCQLLNQCATSAIMSPVIKLICFQLQMQQLYARWHLMLPQYNVAGSLSCLAALRADINMTNYLLEGLCRRVLIHHSPLSHLLQLCSDSVASQCSRNFMTRQTASYHTNRIVSQHDHIQM